ncbi:MULTISPECIES: rhodanese-like domain-containing protein [Exiguobacterium]|jgi:rhodanese-related sulfurtransferase|uniref:Molybdopterin biosynthesis MoeB protein n=1 Tax=Exiguobacterium chiriqhucha RW-2 TaxID=1345023 RepID=U1LXQ2_9BACL|nr:MULTISPECIES: rhodanese-like domain-containing protein [Exiguobacterium]ERG67449.1 molybdopterin biosynthesis MoeB protein [Exiguobacterium chiriqhucha RW-2]KAB2864425.1 MAG: rhodanese-like domain-containing protein [Exiguobacterium chiriqhucha]RHB48889.1 rhodanese-like domain-containing protein [Exiguobacterium sp. AM39-5BH]TCI71493.1 rhodanese-like domain-containing protein [Exiguobacterium sp. IPCI3]TCI81472.1 rhodanese-like domain-containing protein [Exiguobacterium sp. IPCH1]
MQNIHATELREKLENGETLHIIDVREQDEYDAGHIPHVPLYPLSEFPGVTDKLAKDNVYHVICRSGGRSVTACDYLESEGYKVVNVEGGMLAWDGDIEA